MGFGDGVVTVPTELGSESLMCVVERCLQCNVLEQSSETDGDAELLLFLLSFHCVWFSRIVRH